MALNPRRLAGVTSIEIDGAAYNLASGAKWSPSDRSRETLTGMDRVHGYKEMVIAGFIEGTIRDSGAISARTFQEMTAVSVVMRLANGKSVTGSNMWNVKAVEVDSAEGVFEVRFEGADVSEQAGA